ncbi:hypothetical protein [Streptomyces californicus]|uniref:hypothetical protein n=1 Tax=Streptomyces californicus TaxID=67351 RepID=UPI00296F19CD|nr:hypothetical protein [Streptomyces californicus]MDW4912521.1 hypothetical protein [Streptomyces californicus]
MGRHKQHKPRRSRGVGEQPTTEWFGTGFHSTDGMQHLDVRQSGNGILITSAPAEVDGVLAGWPLRIRNDDNGQGLTELGTALAAGQPHGIVVENGPGYERLLMFIPNHPEEAVGTLARVRAEGETDGVVVFERRAERPLALWAEAGESLLRIVPLLRPDAPSADEPEESTPCPGCYRPVYEGSFSGTLIGDGSLPVTGLCRLCVNGTTLRSLRQADVPIDPRQRAVLESVSAVLA